MKRLLKILKEVKGSVLVFTTVVIGSVLIGLTALVTDVGALYLTHSKLENMADAGALAGAQEWFLGDKTQVEAVATTYARDKNGKAGDIIDVDVIEAEKKIVVTATRNVDLFFAKILNTNSSDVTAKSAARILPATKVTGSAPFAITWDDSFLPGGSAVGTNLTLKVDEKDEYKGNFHCLALKSKSGGDSGASVLAENILYGCAQSLAIGDKVSTEPGNMVGPIKKAIADRLALPGGNIMIIPIIEETWTDLGGGRLQVTIKGFAAFDIDASNGKTVTGNFLRLATAADLVTEDDSAASYGLYGTKLVDPN